MSRRCSRPSGLRPRLAAGLASCLLASACGLPDSGAQQVDDSTVPYRLLELGDEPPSGAPTPGRPAPSVPLLFWVDTAQRLVPTAADVTCAQPPIAQVTRLLDALSGGPSGADRSAGRTSAWAQLTRPDLVGLDGSTVVVEVDPRLQTSADRLPLAVGQVVLTLTSARGVGAVEFVAEDGPVQVPLPDGAMTAGPVTSTDYAALVVGRGPPSAERWPGCA